MTKALIHALLANPMSGPENLAVSVVHALCTVAEGRK